MHMLDKVKNLRSVSSHLKNLETVEQNKPKANRKNEMIKMGTEISEIMSKNHFKKPMN